MGLSLTTALELDWPLCWQQWVLTMKVLNKQEGGPPMPMKPTSNYQGADDLKLPRRLVLLTFDFCL